MDEGPNYSRLQNDRLVESTLGWNDCRQLGIGPLTPADQEPIKVKDVADIVAENLS